ncbi:MAG TPA: hypothetical protein PK400_11060 [Phycisphaerales bacterium]|nr:hypothetical protein [Phycisphaerales bacterium]HRQ76455.1 hypothetical protein [Phycisphaerales bacterium]
MRPIEIEEEGWLGVTHNTLVCVMCGGRPIGHGSLQEEANAEALA